MIALPTPVLEIGGTHVTAALVLGGTDVQDEERREQQRPVRRDPGHHPWAVVPGSVVRRQLDAHGSADRLLDALAEAATHVGSGHSGTWGVAVPGPFDYRSGVALYENVGKFDHLRGVDVRAGLMERLQPAPQQIAFLNDADAFGIGEYAIGSAGGRRRAVCITLGTGVGSTFLADAVPVKSGPDVPPDGSCYLLEYRGRPLEDTVSRRAIRREYAAAVAHLGMAPDAVARRSSQVPDVQEIAGLSRAGDALATGVLQRAFAAVGEAAGPYLQRFGAEILIVGGSMAGSWDIVEPAIRNGLAAAAPALAALPIHRAERPEEAGLIGAAYWAHTVTASQG
jgi:glucokinase